MTAIGVLVVASASIAVTVFVLERGSSFAFAPTPVASILVVAAAIALVAAGEVAFLRARPFALVVVGIGVTWGAREWANPVAPGALILTLGFVLATAWVPLTGWLALGYPRGLPRARRDRWVVGFAFVASFAPAFLRTATFDPARSGCLECPANLLLVRDAPQIADAAVAAASVLTPLSGVLIVACLLGRFGRASAAERLLIAPVVVTSGVAIGLAAIGSGLAALFASSALSISRGMTVVVAAVLIGVAAAVSWEIVRVGTALRRSAHLVAELSAAAEPGRLRDELARITHDDSLELVFPLGDRVVDSTGLPATDPRVAEADGMRRATLAVGRDGGAVAVLEHRPGLLDDAGFRDAVTRAASLALEHERLQAELARRIFDLQESRARLVVSFDTERRRLERDLHDGAQQQLVALLLELRISSARHHRLDLQPAIDEVSAALDELRRLAQGIFPAALAEDGLMAALEQLREGAGIPVRLRGVAERRWPPAVETTAYAVVRDTVARGLSSAEVAVIEADGILSVTVGGKQATSAASPRFDDSVAGLADRVGAIGGRLFVDDSISRVVVRAELPCGS